MYTPSHFEETDLAVMQALIAQFPLATLVTANASVLNANHIPMHLVTAGSEFGVLHGHFARANSMCQDIDQQSEVLAIFQSPNAYISPAWYPSKQQDGNVVPTWNYAAVHAYGTMRIIDDPIWLRSQLEALTDQHEASRPEPWQVADAPHAFTEALLHKIIGFEISITRLLGKWKVSQNQSQQNQSGVIAGLQESGQNESAALVAAKLKTMP